MMTYIIIIYDICNNDLAYFKLNDKIVKQSQKDTIRLTFFDSASLIFRLSDASSFGLTSVREPLKS